MWSSWFVSWWYGFPHNLNCKQLTSRLHMDSIWSLMSCFQVLRMDLQPCNLIYSQHLYANLDKLNWIKLKVILWVSGKIANKKKSFQNKAFSQMNSLNYNNSCLLSLVNNYYNYQFFFSRIGSYKNHLYSCCWL